MRCKQYKPSAALKMNQERARRNHPKQVSMATKVDDTRGHEYRHSIPLKELLDGHSKAVRSK